MVLCIYKNCFNEICSWLFDPNSTEKKVIQWAKTFEVHRTAKSLIDRINETDIDSVIESEV